MITLNLNCKQKRKKKNPISVEALQIGAEKPNVYFVKLP